MACEQFRNEMLEHQFLYPFRIMELEDWQYEDKPYNGPGGTYFGTPVLGHEMVPIPCEASSFHQLKDFEPKLELSVFRPYVAYNRVAQRVYRSLTGEWPTHPQFWTLRHFKATRQHGKRRLLCWDPLLKQSATATEVYVMSMTPCSTSDLEQYIMEEQRKDEERWLDELCRHTGNAGFYTENAIQYYGYAQAGGDDDEFFDAVEYNPKQLARETHAKRSRALDIQREKDTERYHDALTGFEKMSRSQKRKKMQFETRLMTGKAQGLFNIPKDVDMNHVIHIPLVEDFIAKLSATNPRENWADMLAEIVFFFIHLKNGGLSVGNIACCTAHLIKNIRGEKLKTAIRTMVNRMKGLAQSVESIMAAIAMCITIAISFLTAMVFKTLPDDKSIDRFINRFSRAGQMITSVEKIGAISSKLTEIVMSFARKSIFHYDSSDFAPFERVDRFVCKVQALNTPDLELRMKDGSVEMATIKSLSDEAVAIQRVLDAHKIPFNETRAFASAAMFVQRMRELGSTNGFGVLKSRIPPLVVHFVGDTGVGKTAMLDYLNANILVERGCREPSDLVNKVYYCYAQNNFFDGFQNGSEVVVFDDIFTVKDSINNPSPEPLMQIRGTNGAPWRPPMADLSGKATSVFEPAVVIWTSNRETYSFESITNPEAIHNRVHMKYRQYARPEYAIEKNLGGRMVKSLDYEKFQRDIDAGKVKRTDAWLFDRRSLEGTTFENLRVGMTFDEVRDEVIGELRAKRRVGGDVLIDRDEYFKSLLPKEPTAVPTSPESLTEPISMSVLRERMDKPSGPTQHGDSLDDDEELFGQILDEDSEDPDRAWGAYLGALAGHTDAFNAEIELPQWKLWFRRLEGRFRYRHVNVLQEGLYALDKVNKMVTNLQDWFKLRETISKGFPGRVITFNAAALCIKVHPEFYEAAQLGVRELYIAAAIRQAPEEFLLERLYQEGKVIICDEAHTAPTTLVRDVKNLFRQVYLRTERLACYPLRPPRSVWEFDDNRPLYNIFRMALCMTTAFMIGNLLARFLCWVIDCFVTVPGYFFSSAPTAKKGKKVKANDAEGIETRSNVEMYQTGGAVAQPKGRFENYQAGSVKAQTSGKVETYSAGGAKTAPLGKVETEVIELDKTVKHIGPTQLWSDQNAGEIRVKVYKNIYCVFSGDDVKEQRKRGTLTFIQGRIGLTNRHIIASFGKVVTIVSPGGIRYQFDASDLNTYSVPDDHVVYGKRDVALVEFPATVHMHGNLVPFFINQRDYEKTRHIGKFALTNVGVAPGGETVYQHVFESKECKAYHTTNFSLNYKGVVTEIRNFWLHNIETAPGDCGGLCVAFDRTLEHKIFGMHMAGYDGREWTGAAVAISREMLDYMLTHMILRRQHSKMSGEAYADTSIVLEVKGSTVREVEPVQVGFVSIGTVRDGVYSAKQSGISQSPLMKTHGPSFRKPAHLTGFWRDGVFHDPMKIAMKKACAANVKTPSWALTEATHAVQQMLCSTVEERDRRVLTFEEAIMGVQGDDRYPPINRSTSCGYGWKHIPGEKGKTAYLGRDEYKLDHPEVLKRYNTALEQLRQGKRIGHYWTDTLKDELRPIEKVDQGKTRMFSVGELTMTLLLRQYFDGFVAHVMRNHTEFESCVGMNVFGYEWDALARRLQSKGEHVVAGDFTNYDGSLPADVVWAVLDVINSFYQDDNDEIRSLLWLEIVNSVHVNGNLVYMWTHGQPSGCPFTSLLNSVVHSIIVRVVYLLAAEKYAPEMCSMQEFDRHVCHNNYGDDDVTNISPIIISWFNQLTMTEMYARFGMTYTDELKTGELVPYKRLVDIQFLKRKFEFDEKQCRYRCPLDLQTIRDMILWNKTKSDVCWNLTALVLQDAVYELAQHREQVFNDNYGYFDSARIQIYRNAPLHFLTYDGYQRLDAFKYVVSDRFDETLSIGAPVYSPCAQKQQILRSPSGPGQAGEGEVFTSSDECVPSINNRLLIRCADEDGLSGSLIEENSLATTYINKDRMEQQDMTSARDFQELTDTFLKISQCYTDIMSKRVNNWTPTDLMYDNTVRSLKRALNSLVTLRTSPSREPPKEPEQNAAELMAYMDKINELPTFLEELRVADSDSEVEVIETRPTCSNNIRSVVAHWEEVDVEPMIEVSIASDTYSSGDAQSGVETADIPSMFAGTDEVIEKLDVTTLHGDGDVNEESRQISRSVPQSMQCGAEAPSAMNLTKFLGRPYLWKDGVWSKSDARGKNLFKMSLPKEWFDIPFVQAKTAGFRFVRCTFTVELQVNAQPFNAGGLLMNFHPLEDQMTLTPSNDSHLAGKMGKPYVVYRCGESTAVRLKVPFMPVISHYDRTVHYGYAGTVKLEVLSPLTGADDVDYAVFIWAEDVDVTLPSGIAQSANLGEILDVKNTMEAAQQLPPVADVSTVPIITEFAKTAEEVITTGSALATAFGWSKPINPDKTENFQPAHVRMMANANGTSDGRVLALDSKNRINTPHDVFNTTEDEMAFSTILAKPSPLEFFTFSKSHKPKNILYQVPVDPTYCTTREGADQNRPGKWRYETYMSYLASCAAYWRGSIKYKIIFFKTPFHSGRIRVSYVPQPTPSRTTPQLNNYDRSQVFSEVHDLRSKMDIDIEIPYSYVQPWKPTAYLSGSKNAKANALQVIPQGWLSIEVVNSLRAPSTAADSIEALVMISGGKDFQFAMPYVNPHTKIVFVADGLVPAQAIMYKEEIEHSGDAESGNFTDSRVLTTPTVNVEGVGEVLTGFRQLLKRYTRRLQTDLDTPFTSFDWRKQNFGDLVNHIPSVMERAGALYRFQAGSMRWLITKTAKDGAPYVQPTLIPATGSKVDWKYEQAFTGSPTVVIPVADLPTELHIPFYQLWPAIMTNVGKPEVSFIYDSNSSGTSYSRIPHNNGVIVYDTGETTAASMGVEWHAIGDDFSFGFLIGPPITYQQYND